ncbi:MAG: M15 family metallopeptidase [Nostoc sp. S4]|nr:M15 family metallopeptidase [Nostoc sp. S4]
MSQQLFEDDVKFLQRFLKSAGFNPGKIDGIWGSKTDAAEDEFLKKSEQIAASYGKFYQRSERNIITLHPKAQEAARQFLKRLQDAGINARIISGTRTYAEQDALYAKGRTQPGSKVTNAKGGQSNHNFGIAWDIGIFDSQGNYQGESPQYDKAAEVGLFAGLEWGGNWQSFQDKPHYQMVTNLAIQQVKERFEKGEYYI